MSIAIARTLDSPLVTILDVDFDRLAALASAGETAGFPAAEFLATELERAVVRPASGIGSGIVRMNARVAFRINDRPDVRVRTLLYPEEYAQRRDQDDCISVMTPLGAALLGLGVGTGMSYETANGTKHYVSVVAVLQQPDPAGQAAAGKDAAMPATKSRHPSHDDDSGPTAA